MKRSERKTVLWLSSPLKKIALLVLLVALAFHTDAQTRSDTLEIKQAALDYIESQHRPNAGQMEKAVHPLLMKRTYRSNKIVQREVIKTTSAEEMILVAETYNRDGNKFPEKPQKEVIIYDITGQVASLKLIADDWIDHMHLVKLNGEWKIINVLWQYKDLSRH